MFDEASFVNIDKKKASPLTESGGLVSELAILGGWRDGLKNNLKIFSEGRCW